MDQATDLTLTFPHIFVPKLGIFHVDSMINLQWTNFSVGVRCLDCGSHLCHAGLEIWQATSSIVQGISRIVYGRLPIQLLEAVQ